MSTALIAGTADRDMATAALRLLAGGLSGYAVRPGPTEGLPT